MKAGTEGAERGNNYLYYSPSLASIVWDLCQAVLTLQYDQLMGYHASSIEEELPLSIELRELQSTYSERVYYFSLT